MQRFYRWVTGKKKSEFVFWGLLCLLCAASNALWFHACFGGGIHLCEDEAFLNLIRSGVLKEL